MGESALTGQVGAPLRGIPSCCVKHLGSQYGAHREAAPRELWRASVEGSWPPSGASRPWEGGPSYDLPRIVAT
eukprot:4148458-Alexandrium_andersonii.AAC.1